MQHLASWAANVRYPAIRVSPDGQRPAEHVTADHRSLWSSRSRILPPDKKAAQVGIADFQRFG